jgi:hypothetical protein
VRAPAAGLAPAASAALASSLSPSIFGVDAGVGASSLMALQSEVAKTQQEASEVREGRLDAEELRARRRGGGGAVAALLGRRNAGVAERDRVDRLEIKASIRARHCWNVSLQRRATASARALPLTPSRNPNRRCSPPATACPTAAPPWSARQSCMTAWPRAPPWTRPRPSGTRSTLR